jgi:hypothetical protein
MSIGSSFIGGFNHGTYPRIGLAYLREHKHLIGVVQRKEKAL